MLTRWDRRSFFVVCRSVPGGGHSRGRAKEIWRGMTDHERRWSVPLLVLIVNSAYLAAFAQPSIFYMGNVLLHLGLGLALMVLAVLWARRSPWECGVFLLAGLPALYLVVRGNTMDHRWALWSHILLAVVAVSLIGLRAFRGAGPGKWRWAIVTAAALAMELVPAFYHKVRPNPNDRIQNPLAAPI